jgi:O-antigen/teichoic acid export membrane protein
MEYIVISNLMISFSFLLLTCIFVYKRGSIFHLVIISLISNLIGLLTSYLFSKRWVKIRLALDINFYKKILKEAYPLGIAFLMISIYWRIDVVMLSLMKGEEAVGLYNISYKFMEMGTILSAMIMASIFPILSENFKKDREYFVEIYQKSLKYMLIIGISLTIFFLTLADKIILYVAGNEYERSIISLQLLGLIFLVYYPGALIGYMFISIGKQWTNTIFNTLAVILNVVLNLLLIPKYSFYGSSFATFITEAVQVIFALLVLGFIFGFSPNLRVILSPILGGGLSLMVLLLPAQTNSFLKLILGFVIFFGFLFLRRDLSKEDIYLLLNKAIIKG